MTTTTKTESHRDDGIGQRIEHAGDHGTDSKDDGARPARAGRVSLGALIKDHPFVAAGLGLGIGYLAARLLHR
jgi:hypothetical protein